MEMERLYDAVIIGGGPAGLTASLYLARAGYRVLVMEENNFGGQIVITEKVVNYPGIYEISGAELTGIMKNRGHVSERNILKPRFCHFVLIRILRLLIRIRVFFTLFPYL